MHLVGPVGESQRAREGVAAEVAVDAGGVGGEALGPLKLLDRKYSRQFCLEQARAFVWGQQPTIANFLPAQLTDRAEELDFVMRLARLRSRAARSSRRPSCMTP